VWEGGDIDGKIKYLPLLFYAPIHLIIHLADEKIPGILMAGQQTIMHGLGI
jgi:hypothetical protein